MWGAILCVGIGGALGAVCRYGLTLLAARMIGTDFPWGTLGANLLGCFLIGLALVFADARVVLGPSERLFFMTGFLGALTTFSTYALETVQFAKAGALGQALLNIVVHHCLGIALVVVGVWCGGWLVNYCRFGE